MYRALVFAFLLIAKISMVIAGVSLLSPNIGGGGGRTNTFLACKLSNCFAQL